MIIIDHFTAADCRRISQWIVLIIFDVIVEDLYIWNDYKIYVENHLFITFINNKITLYKSVSIFCLDYVYPHVPNSNI